MSKSHRLRDRMSLKPGDMEKDVGRLFLLLSEAINLIDECTPEEDPVEGGPALLSEAHRIFHRTAERELHKVVAEINVGLIGRGRKECYDCQACGKKNPPMFMVRDDLWRGTVDKPRAILCLICFENLLGRPVTPDDLKPCTLTDELRMGYEIFSRVGQ